MTDHGDPPAPAQREGEVHLGLVLGDEPDDVDPDVDGADAGRSPLPDLGHDVAELLAPLDGGEPLLVRPRGVEGGLEGGLDGQLRLSPRRPGKERGAQAQVLRRVCTGVVEQHQGPSDALVADAPGAAAQHPSDPLRGAAAEAAPGDVGHGRRDRPGHPSGRANDTRHLAGLGRLAGRHAAQDLDHLLANPGLIGAHLHEHLGRDPLALSHQAEEDVLGPDVVVPELERLAQRQLEHLLRPRRERDVPRPGASPPWPMISSTRARVRSSVDPERGQGRRRDAVALVDQPEEEVLGADVVVVEQARLFLGQDDHPPGPVGEAFEHRQKLSRPRQPAVHQLLEPRCATPGAGGRSRASPASR